ncbi:MAG: cation:proton antiporter, partial [Chloroflexota bacterium]|nr:cation:proton antiporter [Chloroflexota bacterium]
ALQAALFFAVTLAIGHWLFPHLWRYLTRAGLTNRTFHATLILLIALLFAEFAELAGLHAILGAFLAGLFLREGIVLERRLSIELTALVHDMSIGFLAPIFFVTAGFHVSLTVFQTDLALLLAVVVVATLGKIVGTALFYLPSGNGWREGVVVGAGMNGRGAVEIIIAEIGLTAGLISQDIFSILVFMAIFTTATVPVLLKWGTDWLKGHGQLVRAAEERSGTIIVGASPTARALGKTLLASQPVWLIDNNRAALEVASAEGLPVVHGNALDAEVLSAAHAPQARWFLALTSNPEVNILAAQLARKVFSIPDVYALLPSQVSDSQRALLEDIPARPLAMGRAAFLQQDRWFERNDLHPRTLTIAEPMDPQRLLAQVEGEYDGRPVIVARNDTLIPFMAVEALEAGDEVIVLSPNGEVADANTTHVQEREVIAVPADDGRGEAPDGSP